MLVYGSNCPKSSCLAPLYSPSNISQVPKCSSPLCAFSTCNSNECDVVDCYGDNSGASSVVTIDTVGLVGVPKAAFTAFGNIFQTYSQSSTACGVAGPGFEIPPFSGIFGVAFPLLQVIPDNKTVLDAICDANDVPRIFSLCINPNQAFLSLGQDYYTKFPSFFAWLPLWPLPPLYYSIILLGVRLVPNNSPQVLVPLNSSFLESVNTIVDSGTTFISVPNALAQSLFQTLQNMCSTVTLVGICGKTFATSIINLLCYKLTSEEMAAYPVLQLSLLCVGGVPCSFDIPPSLYFLPCSSADFFTVGVQLSGDNTFILGDLFMQNFHVVFDKVHYVVGFGNQTTCSLNPSHASSSSPSPSPASALSAFWL